MRFTIKRKLLFWFFVVALFFGVASFKTVEKVSLMHQSFDSFADSDMVRILALQELKSIAGEIYAEAISFQFDQSEGIVNISDKKSSLLSVIEKMNQWENIYKTKTSESAAEAQRALDMINTAKNKVVLDAIEVVRAKEEQQEAMEVRGLEERLERSSIDLKEIISVISNSERAEIGKRGELMHQVALETQFLAVLMAISGTVFALLIGLIAAQFFSSRLVMLRNIAIEFQKGSRDHRSVVKSRDEIGELGNALNDMVGSLAHSERKLKEERDRANTILVSLVEGLLVVDDAGRVVLLNPAAERLLGISFEEAKQKHLSHLYTVLKDGHELPEERRPVANTLKTGKSEVYEVGDNVSIKTASGASFFVALSTAPLYGDEQGTKIVGGVIVFRSVDEEKKLEDSRTGFISIASHQLRTPLTSMRWFLEMLLAGDAGPLSEEQKHFVERVSQGTDRMIDLVGLLLQIARVEAGRVKIDPVRTDFVTLSKGVALALKADLDAKQLGLEVRGDPSLPLVLMDQEVLWQVVQNLLSNAIRYSHEKGNITISVVQKGSMLEYSIHDNGIGIPSDQQDKVFEKFFRAENALRFVPEGSGLGLSLVKSLVEGWGGSIWFESEEGTGTTFFFTVSLEGMKKRTGEVGLKV